MRTRRGFIGTAAAMVAKAAQSPGASSALALGIIGTGRRGRYVGAMFGRDDRVHIAALSDLYDDQLEAAKAEIPGAASARVYRDYREMLASPAIDAVYIATPPWLHPDHFEAAVDARKHIYSEKPAAAGVEGVARVARAGSRADASKHIVFGLQRRFAPHYRTAHEIVQSGRFGPLLYMKSNWVSWGVLAQPFTPDPKLSAEDRRMKYWPHFKETSGDFIVEQDCHGMDVLNWFAGAHPLRASAKSGRGRRQYGDNSDWFHVSYEYPNGLTGLLVGTQLSQQRFSDVKEQFMGLDGTLETHLNYYRLHQGPGKLQQVDAKYDVTQDAVREFVDQIVAGRPGNTTAIACEATYTALLGRIAAETGRVVTWEEILGSGAS